MNRGNARPVSRGGISVQVLSVDKNLASIRRVISRHYLDQRRFASPVLAYQGVDFARSYFEVDIVQGNHTRERLGYAAGHQHGFDRRTGCSDGIRGDLRFVVHKVRAKQIASMVRRSILPRGVPML
jgi:hypothetical protein